MIPGPRRNHPHQHARAHHARAQQRTAAAPAAPAAPDARICPQPSACPPPAAPETAIAVRLRCCFFLENVTSRCSNSGNAASARPTERRRFSRTAATPAQSTLPPPPPPAAPARAGVNPRSGNAYAFRISVSTTVATSAAAVTTAAPRTTCIQPQPLLHLPDVEVELLSLAHSFLPLCAQ